MSDYKSMYFWEKGNKKGHICKNKEYKIFTLSI
jgi:hypothetical protein